MQQWARLESATVFRLNFYLEIQDSATWEGNGNPSDAGDGADALNHSCGTIRVGDCRLGIRAGYVLARNVGGIQGLSVKAGR